MAEIVTFAFDYFLDRCDLACRERLIQMTGAMIMTMASLVIARSPSVHAAFHYWRAGRELRRHSARTSKDWSILGVDHKGRHKHTTFARRIPTEKEALERKGVFVVEYCVRGHAYKLCVPYDVVHEFSMPLYASDDEPYDLSRSAMRVEVVQEREDGEVVLSRDVTSSSRPFQGPRGDFHSDVYCSRVRPTDFVRMRHNERLRVTTYGNRAYLFESRAQISIPALK